MENNKNDLNQVSGGIGPNYRCNEYRGQPVNYNGLCDAYKHNNKFNLDQPNKCGTCEYYVCFENGQFLCVQAVG